MLRCVLLIVAAAACVAAAPLSHTMALFHPNSASMNAPCPHTYTVLFHTTKGDFEVQVEQAWAPIGSQRFYNLVKNGFYNDVAFFRTVPNFMVQFGIPGNPKLASKWQGDLDY
jgi:peptidyl-prolyl cis-trans isomerase A (cyclophilin A)